MDKELLRYIVPLGVFAFWVLSRLSERNVKPLPPQGRAPAPRPMPQQAVLRWSNQGGGPAPAGAGGRDDILILGEETRPARPPQGQPRARQRQAKPPKPQQQKPARTRRSTDVTADVSHAIQQSMSITPLTVAAPPLTMSTPAARAVDPPGAGSPIHALHLRAALTDPVRVRETILLNEILQPPLALRRRRG